LRVVLNNPHPMPQIIDIALHTGKKLYFASDFHLGAPDLAASHVREKRIVQWLDHIKTDAQVIFLVGDLFDFWHEYRTVVPRGYVRLLGKLAELNDSGIEVVVFTGNHDMWMSDYFETELGLMVIREPVELVVRSLSNIKEIELKLKTQNSKLIYLAHGDGLGPGDFGFKILKKVFQNKVIRWAFRALLHPDFALSLGYLWAGHSWRKHAKEGVSPFFGEDREWLVQYAKSVEAKIHHDYYIFGHRHILLNHDIDTNSKVIILGDWIQHDSYAVFDGNELELNTFG
jgi:UDP-2,3-diacylglucosamine hydrolase